MTDPIRASQHAVSLIASIAAPPRRDLTGEPTDAQWAAQIRRIADMVWAEAWHAGAAYQASVQARPVVMAAPSSSARGDAYRFSALADRDPEMAEALGRFWWRPFNDRRIALLTAWQRSGRFHPYTCPEEGHPPLVAWIAGWRCEAPGCAYTQDWAHPVPDEVAADLLGGTT